MIYFRRIIHQSVFAVATKRALDTPFLRPPERQFICYDAIVITDTSEYVHEHTASVRTG